MSEPESKKLEKARNAFVDAMARYWTRFEAGTEPLAEASELAGKILLSVLAEEAPPTPKLQCGVCGHPPHTGVCPAYHVPIVVGAAPAPKQERGVEEILTHVFDRMAHPMTAATRARIREMLATAIKGSREERAASASQIRREMDRADENAYEWKRYYDENASLRERIEKALKLAKDLEPRMDDHTIKHRRIWQIIQELEGKSWGAEATE